MRRLEERCRTAEADQEEATSRLSEAAMPLVRQVMFCHRFFLSVCYGQSALEMADIFEVEMWAYFNNGEELLVSMANEMLGLFQYRLSLRFIDVITKKSIQMALLSRE